MIRLQPTALGGMIEGMRAIAVSCGHRHSMLVFDHRPLRVMDDAQFQPYVKILEVLQIGYGEVSLIFCRKTPRMRHCALCLNGT